MTEEEKLRRLRCVAMGLSSAYQAGKDDLIELINGALSA